MSGSEFAFLAFGLVVGCLVGGAVIAVARARPPAPREVRLTMAPGNVSRRVGTTLGAAAIGDAARGGPGDPGQLESAVAQPAPTLRTRVLAPASAIGVPVRPEHDLDLRTMLERSGRAPSLADRLHSAEGQAESAPVLVGAAAGRGTSMTAGDGHGPAAASAAMTGGRDGARDEAGAQDEAGARAVAPSAEVAGSSEGGQPANGTADEAFGGDASATDPCGAARQAVADRCGLAERLRAVAQGAEDHLRELQRDYDQHQTVLAEAEHAADARAMRTAKEAAQAAFRRDRNAARDRAGIEAAARTWLTEINRINRATREATTVLQRERVSVARLGLDIERAAVEADARRIGAEAAEEECQAARAALAACEEAHRPATRRAGPRTAAGERLAAAAIEAGAGLTAEEVLLDDERPPAVVRLLQGDRSCLFELVAQLAGEDRAEQRRWQLLLTDLVDAILARTIEAGVLDYPADHPFWSLFTAPQQRDIGRALASLGYHFDGLGGFADDRVPSQRDLSLAIGYAGLDPMRVRRWPSEAEMVDLLREVTVGAPEELAAEAGGLTLGEMVAFLGRRADALADLWNAWGRVRPLLLDIA